MSKEFIRRDANRYSKIGKNRKKLQKWRRPKGRDNKMRLKRKSYPKVVKIGHATKKKDSGKINGKTLVRVHNLTELNAITKTQIAILARVGAKKKMELIKHAQEKNIEIFNVGTGGKNETRA